MRSKTAWYKSRRVVLAGLLVGLSIGSCGGSDDEKLEVAKLTEPCSLNSECENPYVCTFERCHQECVEDRDCSGEQRCVKGVGGNVCQLAVETECTTSADCKGDQVCGVDRECRDECTTDADCTTGQVCANSNECASTEPDKDVVDENGDIQRDPFMGDAGSGGTGGGSGGGAGKGGSGGSSGTGGTSSGGSAGMSGGAGDSGGCPKGYDDCDDDPTDCETQVNLVSACGSCTTSCDASHGGDVTCDPVEFVCTVNPATCTAGFADCDDNGVTGCEAELATDAANCGQCGRGCGGGECVNGQCRAGVIADPPGDISPSYLQGYLQASRVVIQQTYNPWETRTVALPPATPPGEGTVVYTAPSGTSLRAETVTTDATNIYFATNTINSTVLRKALDGSGAAATAFQATAGYIYFLVNTTTAFYYVTYEGGQYNFYQKAKNNDTPPSAIPGLSGRGAIYNLFATPSRLFWVEYVAPNYHVMSAPLAGGTPVDHDGASTNRYIGLVSDGSYVYWNQYAASGEIRRIANTGEGTPAAVTAGLANQQGWLAVDDTYVYYLAASYELRRAPKDGSADSQLIATLNAPPYFNNLFGVDDAYLYGFGNNGVLLRVSKTPSGG